MDIAEIADDNFDAAPFWEAAKAGQLVVARCSDCSRAHYYPREICPFCRSASIVFEPASGRGKIYSLTVSKKPDQTRVVAYVTLDEGPTLMSKIVDAPETIAIADTVYVGFEQQPDGMTVPVFRVSQT